MVALEFALPGESEAGASEGFRTLLQIEGEPGDRTGSVVAGWSGDGRSFLVIGSPGAGGRGVVRVYTDLSGEPAFTIEAEETGAQLGAMFASVVGDINGDGVQDIYASDWNDGALGPATGRIYVHSGADGSRAAGRQHLATRLRSGRPVRAIIFRRVRGVRLGSA